MGCIDSISSLLQMLYKKATYISCMATGYNSSDIHSISFDDNGSVFVYFEWWLPGCGNSKGEYISINDTDFSDVDAAINRIKKDRVK